MKQILSIISAVVFTAAFFPYIFGIISKKTKPMKSTWIVWVSLDTITFIAMVFEDVVSGTIVAAVSGGRTIVVLAIIFGQSGWSRLDKFCLVGGLIGIILWGLFKDPILGIIISLSVVFLGSIPTFISTWKDPRNEDLFSWSLFLIANIISLFAIKDWALVEVAQPIVFTAVALIVFFLAMRRFFRNG